MKFWNFQNSNLKEMSRSRDFRTQIPISQNRSSSLSRSLEEKLRGETARRSVDERSRNEESELRPVSRRREARRQEKPAGYILDSPFALRDARGKSLCPGTGRRAYQEADTHRSSNSCARERSNATAEPSSRNRFLQLTEKSRTRKWKFAIDSLKPRLSLSLFRVSSLVDR